MPSNIHEKLVEFLRDFKDVFAWFYEVIPKIDLSVMVHRLIVNLDLTQIGQKRRSFNAKKYVILMKKLKNFLGWDSYVLIYI